MIIKVSSSLRPFISCTRNRNPPPTFHRPPIPVQECTTPHDGRLDIEGSRLLLVDTGHIDHSTIPQRDTHRAYRRPLLSTCPPIPPTSSPSSIIGHFVLEVVKKNYSFSLYGPAAARSRVKTPIKCLKNTF